MVRSVIGGIAAGVIIFVMAFIFWASPLGAIAFTKASDTQAAAIQTSLAQNLTQSGTGTYLIPDPGSREGAALYAKGPVATVSYNTAGYSPEDMSALLPGIILAVATGLLMSFGLAAFGGGRSFAEAARLVVLYTVGIALWECLTNVIFGHSDWKYWIYALIATSVTFIVPGLVIARWFLPAHAAAHRETPAAGAGEI
jgi:hypothetical protein